MSQDTGDTSQLDVHAATQGAAASHEKAKVAASDESEVFRNKLRTEIGMYTGEITLIDVQIASNASKIKELEEEQKELLEDRGEKVRLKSIAEKAVQETYM